MENNNLELRKALNPIVSMPPSKELIGSEEWRREMLDWGATVPAKISALPGHNVELVKLVGVDDRELFDQNCFMYSLNLSDDNDRLPLIRDSKVYFRFQIEFADHLIGHLQELETVVDGCLVVYFDHNDIPAHAGIWRGDRVESKWGHGPEHVWLHGLWEVPTTYGNSVRFYAMPTKEEVMTVVREWVAAGAP